ncbi:MAG: cytochrome bc1 complex diheme cytochrome c subunit [Acidimicrobiales bacterium]
MARRLLIPFALVLAAAALGTFVLGRSRVSASSPSLQNPGMRLAATSHQTLSAEVAEGRTLFSETCASCHGGDAQGGNTASGTGAPKLQGVGGATVDLWLSAGWMPLKTSEPQPPVKAVYFSRQQILDIVAFVESTAPTLPGNYNSVPLNLKGASQSKGFDIFSLNCAPCHTITGSGDALAYGVQAPSLHRATPLMVLQAIRTGPQNMPKFGPNDISNQEANDVVAYVTKDVQHPADIGGLGLGGVGPVAEGFVGLFIGVGVCLVAAYWVGDRTDPTAYGDEAHGDEATGEDEDGDAQGNDGDTDDQDGEDNGSQHAGEDTES